MAADAQAPSGATLRRRLHEVVHERREQHGDRESEQPAERPLVSGRYGVQHVVVEVERVGDLADVGEPADEEVVVVGHEIRGAQHGQSEYDAGQPVEQLRKDGHVGAIAERGERQRPDEGRHGRTATEGAHAFRVHGTGSAHEEHEGVREDAPRGDATERLSEVIDGHAEQQGTRDGEPRSLAQQRQRKWQEEVELHLHRQRPEHTGHGKQCVGREVVQEEHVHQVVVPIARLRRDSPVRHQDVPDDDRRVVSGRDAQVAAQAVVEVALQAALLAVQLGHPPGQRHAVAGQEEEQLHAQRALAQKSERVEDGEALVERKRWLSEAVPEVKAGHEKDGDAAKDIDVE
jgi:hypothetical protein